MDGYDAIRLFGHEAIKPVVAHGPRSVDVVEFQQHLLLNLRPHITVPMLAFQIHLLDQKTLETPA